MNSEHRNHRQDCCAKHTQKCVDQQPSSYHNEVRRKSHLGGATPATSPLNHTYVLIHWEIETGPFSVLQGPIEPSKTFRSERCRKYCFRSFHNRCMYVVKAAKVATMHNPDVFIIGDIFFFEFGVNLVTIELPLQTFNVWILEKFFSNSLWKSFKSG